jgi:hypothetical protein
MKEGGRRECENQREICRSHVVTLTIDGKATSQGKQASGKTEESEEIFSLEPPEGRHSLATA